MCEYACECMCVLGQSQCCTDTSVHTVLPIGVLERLNCLEGKVFDLWSGQESQTTAIQYLQSGQDSLSQRMERMETQPRGRSHGS